MLGDIRPQVIVQDCFSWNWAVPDRCSDNFILYERSALETVGPLARVLHLSLNTFDIEGVFPTAAASANVGVWRVGLSHIPFIRVNRLKRSGALCVNAPCIKWEEDLAWVHTFLPEAKYAKMHI